MKLWLTRALLVVTSIVVALVLCEAGLWLGGIEYPIFYDPDPILGSKLRPGSQGYWLQEGGGWVSINSDGLRDREHSLSPLPNTLRIAVLGDSYTEAMQVNREEAFWAVMERDLQGCGNLGGRQVEVINFGRSGFGTTRELLTLRHQVWKYSPEVVLLAFYSSNDVAENSKDLALQWGDQYEPLPYYTYQDSQLVLDDRRTKEKWLETQQTETRVNNSWWGQLHKWLKYNSRTFQLVGQWQKVAGEQWWAAEKREKSAAAKFGPKANNFEAIYLEPTDVVWEEAWRITEEVLLLMRNETAQRGAKFFLVVLTNPMQVHPDPSVRTKFVHKLGVQDLFYPDRRLENFCRREGIPILRLAPAFQEYVKAHQVYLHGFKGTFGFGGTLGSGHWNQQAHRLAGQMIAEWLCGQIN